MKPYSQRREPRGHVCLTHQCSTRRRALKRDKAAARQAFKAEDQQSLETAFLQGAKWWEWTMNDATMWPSDQDRALKEAARKRADATLGQPLD